MNGRTITCLTHTDMAITISPIPAGNLLSLIHLSCLWIVRETRAPGGNPWQNMENILYTERPPGSPCHPQINQINFGLIEMDGVDLNLFNKNNLSLGSPWI